jgi:hypothetical protein
MGCNCGKSAVTLPTLIRPDGTRQQYATRELAFAAQKEHGGQVVWMPEERKAG